MPPKRTKKQQQQALANQAGPPEAVTNIAERDELLKELDEVQDIFSIVIPPKPQLSSNGACLLITHIDIVDFKSYSGNQTIGPFHHLKYNKCLFVYKRARIPDSPNFEATLSDADLRKPIEESTKLYYEENKCYPERVLVYRFGASQGEIEKIQSEECPRIVYGFKSASGQMPKVTVVAVRRHHNTRIFKQPHLIDPNAKAPEQNATPGSCVRGNAVIDSVMVPHRALQGTAKPTIYSTIFPGGRDNDLSENFLKNMTHAFCYMHEIVNTAISVPHTLRSAEQMANRGTKLWHSRSHELPNSEDFLLNATRHLNPKIETRYWA